MRNQGYNPEMPASSDNRADTENLVLLADHLYEEMVSRFGPSSPTTLQPAYSQ